MGIFHGPNSPSRPFPPRQRHLLGQSLPAAPPHTVRGAWSLAPSCGPRCPGDRWNDLFLPPQLGPADLMLLLSPHPPCSYYLKESKGSRRWLLFLEGASGEPRRRGGRRPLGTDADRVAVPAGGWYCFNRENCDSRYDTMRRLMSSRDWPRTRTGQQVSSTAPRYLLGGRVGQGGAHSSKFPKNPCLLLSRALGSPPPSSLPLLRSADTHLSFFILIPWVISEAYHGCSAQHSSLGQGSQCRVGEGEGHVRVTGLACLPCCGQIRWPTSHTVLEPRSLHSPSPQKDPCLCPSPGTGILSSQPEENPHWWNANMV